MMKLMKYLVHQIPSGAFKIHVKYHVIKNVEVENIFYLFFGFEYDQNFSGFRDIILITNISHNNFQKSNLEMTSRKQNATDGKVVESVGKVGQPGYPPFWDRTFWCIHFPSVGNGSLVQCGNIFLCDGMCGFGWCAYVEKTS